MKLRRLLLGAFTVFTVVPVCTLGLLSYTSANTRSAAMARETLTVATQLQANRLTEFFNQHITQTELLADTPLLGQTLLAAGQPQPLSAAAPQADALTVQAGNTLLQWSSRLTHVQRILLCDTNLQVVASSQLSAPMQLTGLTQQQLQRLQGGSTLVATLAPVQQGAMTKLFSIIAPVTADNTCVGYLALETDTAFLVEMAKNFSLFESGQMWLFDSSGTLAAASASPQFTTISNLYTVSDLSRTLVLDKAFSFRLNRAPYFGYFTKVENAGWRILCIVQQQDFAQPSSHVWWLTLATTGVVLLMMLALHRLITYFFTRPMAVLERSIREIDAGNYSRTVPHLGKTELGEIGTAFNKMLGRIRDDRAELALKEERHRIINEQSSSVIFEYNVETHYMTTSPGGRVLWGFPACMEQFPDSLLEAGTLLPEAAAELDLVFTHMLRGQKKAQLELKLFTSQSEWRWFTLLLSTISDNETHKPLRVVGKLTDIDEQKRKTEHLALRATRDSLTELCNKAATQAQITDALTRRNPARLHALMLVDIDHFKRVNDGYGHQKGDTVLRAVAEVLTRQFRPCDVVGRVGGDEFMVLLCDMPDEQSVRNKAAQLLADMHTVLLDEATGDRISVSAGIALCPQDAANYETLYARADTAAYAAKHAGRDAYRLYADCNRGDNHEQE